MPVTADDVFHAISDPRRRDLLNALVGGEPCAVNELVVTLGLPQPAVSKHLAVLREAGIVTVTKHGKQRLYRLDAGALKPVHDWVQIFERFWANQLDGIKRLAERKAAQQSLAAKAAATPSAKSSDSTSTSKPTSPPATSSHPSPPRKDPS